ncbi:hypothetical protein C8R41DRAFT_869064 [Lentinula lateritia]|uniref:DNA helicase n=1 Tax=Lentinula lateritia TaxID=40482 RepID=A0ABQ8V8W4_9AGAR|nr:hypothetical protein C8R41DRAFT_869064 [Lentinula lateritia]
MLVHGAAGSGKTTMVSALFDFISRNHSPTLAFKGAATDAGAALIGGVPLTSIPHSTTMDGGQQYFLIDVAGALDIEILHGLSTQLNLIHDLPTAIFGGKNVILFADFFQTPPSRNRFNAIWYPNDAHGFLIRPFLSNVSWLQEEPLAVLPDTTITDKIRLDALCNDDFIDLNKHVLNPTDFVTAHASHNFAIVTPSAARCKQWNNELPIHIATALQETLYILNASDNVSFSVGATVSIADLTHLQHNVANCGDIPGKMSIYIGMPCSVVIDSTPVWGSVFDIKLDALEDIEFPRPSIVDLKHPPASVTLKVANELLLHNPDLSPLLQLKPVRRRYEWFLDVDEAVMGYVVRLQVPIAPRLSMLEKDCDGQAFEHVLVDTQSGYQSLRSFYMVASRVRNLDSLAITHKLFSSADGSWVRSLRQAILQLLYL